jgi:hypothetical protein
VAGDGERAKNTPLKWGLEVAMPDVEVTCPTLIPPHEPPHGTKKRRKMGRFLAQNQRLFCVVSTYAAIL